MFPDTLCSFGFDSERQRDQKIYSPHTEKVKSSPQSTPEPALLIFVYLAVMDRNLVANATSADDSPTPGYMLNDIAREFSQ